MALRTIVPTEPVGANAAGLPVWAGAGAWTQLAFDDFNRADSATLGSTSIGAKPWTPTPGSSSTPRITGNKMINDQATGRRTLIDTGTSDYRVSAKIAALGAGVAQQELGIMARCTNFDSYVYLSTRLNDATPGISLLKLVGGSFTTIATNAAVTPVVGDVLKFEVEGTTLRGYRNDVLVVEGTETGLTTGKPGLFIGGAGSTNVCAWDDAKFEIRA